MAYFLSFHSLGDKFTFLINMITFLPLIIGVCHIPIFLENFP